MVMSQEAESWKAPVRVYVHRLAPAPRPCDGVAVSLQSKETSATIAAFSVLP